MSDDERLTNDGRVARIMSEVDYHICCIEECDDADLDAEEKKQKTHHFLSKLAEALAQRRPLETVT